MSQSSKLTSLFQPRSVAVIGASADPAKIGSRIVENIRVGGFGGAIYAVNPKGGKLHGEPMYSSVDDIDQPLDVAVIAVPAPRVRDAVASCCRKKVKHALVVSSGFSEIGNRAEEAAIVALAREHGMRILGPNIFGVYSAAAALNATFGPSDIQRGSVAIVSQSGALGLAMIGKTTLDNIGLSAIVSVGNKADLNEVELIDYLIADPLTEVILLYMEGIRDGAALVEVLRRATRQKPVVAIKSGRSRRGAMAAASHTGSLAGADEVFDAVMGQCGVLRAESLGEAFDLCRTFAATAINRADPLLIITNGGGIGVLAADACEKYGVSLLDNPGALNKAFHAITPAFGSTRNPIDLTGGATPADYDAALKAALDLPGVGGVLALYCETAVFDVPALARILEESAASFRAAGKPVAYSAIGGEQTERAIEALRRSRVPVFGDVYDAVFCLGGVERYLRHRDVAVIDTPQPAIDLEAINGICEAVLADDRYFLLADEGATVLAAAGIAQPPGGIATTIPEAVGIAEKIGYPVALKIVSKDVIHKSDSGGVALSLENRDEVIEAFEAIGRNVLARHPQAAIRGIEIARMAPPGVEMIAAARRDPVFGPTVMVGLGGIYVEVFKDVSFGAVPVDRPYVTHMIRRLRTFPLLVGARGEEPKDIESLVTTVLKLSHLIQGCPAITDIEINPLRVFDAGDGAQALDIRILLQHPERDRAEQATAHGKQNLPAVAPQTTKAPAAAPATATTQPSHLP